MDLANIDFSSEGISIDVCHSAAANMSLGLDLEEARNKIFIYIFKYAQAASGIYFKNHSAETW